MDRLSPGVSLRAVAVGLVAACALNLLVIYVEYVAHASRVTLSHFPIAMAMVFVSIVLLLNPLAKCLNRRWGLSPSEMLTILAMCIVSATIPSVGLAGYMLGVMASPYYFASPENGWAAYLHDHVPAWIAPTNDHGATRYLFEGLPEGHVIPWAVWAGPVFAWMSLVCGIAFLSMCLAVMLRRQWVRHERLIYPVLVPAVEMTAGSDGPGIRPAFARGKIFWAGFGVSFGIVCFNIVSYFKPGFPQVPNITWGPWINIGQQFPGIWARINLYTISFSYFANLDLLFSLWFFDLLFVLQAGVLNRLGFHMSTVEDGVGKYATSTYRWQTFGAFAVLVLWGLWTARHHLREVAKKALGRRVTVDDSEEMLSYRVAFFGFWVALAFVFLWLRASGMETKVALVYVAASLVVYLGVARVVCESGLIYVGTPLEPQVFTIDALNARSMSAASLTALAFSNALSSMSKGLFMTAFSHAAKLGDLIRGSRRAVGAGIALAFVAGFVTTVLVTLLLGYSVGAYNFNDFPFARYSQSGFYRSVALIKDPEPRHVESYVLCGIGAAVMSGLTFLRYRFPAWPLHPLGFAISGTFFARLSTFTVFLSWGIKWLILKVGGVAFYRRCRPFFLGLLTGYILGVGLSVVVDAIWFPGQGHLIHAY